MQSNNLNNIQNNFSIEKQIYDTVHKAFWNSLKEDFDKDPVDYKHAFIIINEAKQVNHKSFIFI